MEWIGDTVDVREANLDGWRSDGIADGIDLMRVEISGGSCDDGNLQAFCCEHFLKSCTDVVVCSAVGRDLAVIKRNLRVKLGVEIGSGCEGKILQLNWVEVGGRRQQKCQILTVELESNRREDSRTQ